MALRTYFTASYCFLRHLWYIESVWPFSFFHLQFHRLCISTRYVRIVVCLCSLQTPHLLILYLVALFYYYYLLFILYNSHTEIFHINFIAINHLDRSSPYIYIQINIQNYTHAFQTLLLRENTEIIFKC